MTPQEPNAQDRALPAIAKSRWQSWRTLLVVLLPATVIAAWVPGLDTQDGPAHLYNAHVLVQSLRPGSEFSNAFTVNWSPLPNWLGHVMVMSFVSVLPWRVASALATTLPLVGLACSTFWLKRRVAGPGCDAVAAFYSALTALNVCWLLGFTSFLIGSCLFSITLGMWWSARDRFGPVHAIGLAMLVVLGYFAHVVSLGLTVVGIVVLAVATPGIRLRSRLLWTLVGLSPLAVLFPLYRGLMGKGGPVVPAWRQLKNLRSLDSWAEQLRWVDPVTLASKRAFPLISFESNWLVVVTPVTLLLVATFVLLMVRRDGGREFRGWAILAFLLVVGGYFSPDTLGPTHGDYLPQRIVLLGLVSLLPWLDTRPGSRRGRVAWLLLLAAVVVQSLTVLDYARESSERVGPFQRSRTRIGRNQRIGTLLVKLRGRFRANSLLHADNWLGIGTGNILWSDYETRFYYFPVQFRDDVIHPPSELFEDVARLDDPKDAERRARLWEDLLSHHHGEIDVLIQWGTNERLAEINARWFETEPIDEDGPLKAFRHR